MDREQFIDHIRIILYCEGYQSKKGKVIASSVRRQRAAINAVAKALEINTLSYDEVESLGFGM